MPGTATVTGHYRVLGAAAMLRKTVAVTALTLAALAAGATAANANPGPGASNQCAPGQQGNQDPGFKPGSCDNK